MAQDYEALMTRQQRDDLQHLMGQEEFQRLIARVLERCGIRRPSFNESAMRMAANEGERNIGLWLETLLLTQDRGFMRTVETWWVQLAEMQERLAEQQEMGDERASDGSGA